MIRSAPTSLKFANTGKRQQVARFMGEYRRVLKFFVGKFWSVEKLQKFGDSKCESWLSARAKQCAAKQAVGIVRAVRKKYDSRAFIIKRLKSEGDYANAERLQKIQDQSVLTLPEVQNANAELDSRFCEIRESSGRFDLWLKLSSLGEKINIRLPACKTKTFNKWALKGDLRPSIRLNEGEATFFFECEPEKRSGSTLGVDIGLTKTLSTSSEEQSAADNHGHTLSSICKSLARKQKGSKAFARTQEHRRNYIRWAINQLNLSNVGEIRLENIKNLRKGKRSSALLARWNYADIFEALKLKCEELGVQVTLVQNAYTSRRCHACGWTEKRNRKGETFKCRKCGHSANADINAAKNIALNLSIERRPNLDQFYWSAQELIVPAAKKAGVE
jgi:IS605 OrfB family transposase